MSAIYYSSLARNERFIGNDAVERQSFERLECFAVVAAEEKMLNV
jgi:hypothetical protein